jgi:hypothetical protein
LEIFGVLSFFCLLSFPKWEMKLNNTILLVALAIAGYWAYTKYGTISNLQFIPRGISVSGGGFQIVLGVINTSSYPLQYNSFAGSLIVNGSNVGLVSDFNPQPIIANGETDLTFNVQANLLGLASSILSQINSGVTGIQTANINGTANIGGVQYPVNVDLA